MGLVSLAFSLIYLPAILVAIVYQDSELPHLLTTFAICFFTGLIIWLANRHHQPNLRKKDGFLIVTAFWLLLSLYGATTLWLALDISPYDALFESVSGLTTTGATVLTGLDTMPPSMLFFRQELQWFGGIGLVVFAIAIIPKLGIGGMSIYLAEAPGPMKEEKLTPRIFNSSKVIWQIYIGLTALCATAYWLAGMTPFDAIAHSLSTLSTGGFSTHDLSLGYFNSPAIEYIAALFMALGAINFSVHYAAFHHRSLAGYFRDAEVVSFLMIILAAIILVSVTLHLTGYYLDDVKDLRATTFEVISVITSTGFGGSEDYSTWPLFLPFFLIMISFIGGCGGSTAGGMKVSRILVLTQLTYRETLKLIHPDGTFAIKFNGTPLQRRIMQSIFGFFSLYIASFLVLFLSMMALGVDQVTAFSAIATCMNNLGPGLGEVTSSFASLSDGAKVISVIAMLLGRLEVLSLLVLLSPAYWRA